MSHLALRRTFTDCRSLENLKDHIALLCSLLSESRSSWRFVPPHTDMVHATAGIISLKYKFKRSCLGKTLLFFRGLSLLAKLFFNPLILMNQPACHQYPHLGVDSVLPILSYFRQSAWVGRGSEQSSVT